MRITLSAMPFYAYHGCNPEERVLGAHYRVDVTLLLDAQLAAQQDMLAGTVDYTQIYNMVAAQMASPANLLEHLAYRIAQAIAAEHRTLAGGSVQVAKLNPPLGGLCAEAAVAYSWGSLSDS